jgi:hypothetical protein
MVNKTPRATESRVKSERKKSWVNPSSLEAPPAPTGFKHRWIRESVRGYDDKANVYKRLREGYELVRAEEYPDWNLPTIDDGKHAGVIGIGGLLLARIPLEIAEDRNKHFEDQTRAAQEAVDNDLLKASDPRMPISKPDRQSRVTFGGKSSKES